MNEPTDAEVRQNPAPKGRSTRLAFRNAKRRLWSVPHKAARRRWGALKLERRFLIVAALTVGLSMLTLGYWVEGRIRSGWVQGMAETGALYMEGFLAPHVQALDASGTLPQESRDKIEALLFNTNLGDRVAIIKIWDLEGNLILSTNKLDSPDKKFNAEYFSQIKDSITSGQVVIKLNSARYAEEMSLTNLNRDFIELYAPIYKQHTKDLIAIGEFYEFSYFFNKESSGVRYAIWLLIISAMVLIVVLLQIIVKRASIKIGEQQALLENNLTRAATLAKRNNTLRREADRARLNATILNESYLASIGADIHDGPIQILSLMMLKLPEAGDQAPQSGEGHGVTTSVREDLEPLIQQTLADLRNLSAGLVLPEVENLSIAETIDLAALRHEQQTGTTVERDVVGLPEHVPSAIRVCAYRIVQEALNNAYKHAGGNGQKVSAWLEANMLQILVADSGFDSSLHVHSSVSGARIGLRGMDSRIKALRGSLTVTRLANGGTRVQVTLPVHL